MSSAIKSLKGTDLTVSPFKVYKQYNIPSSSFGDNDIVLYTGSYINQISTPISQSLINYNSVKQLYYSGFLTSSFQKNNISGSYYNNFIQSTAASGTIEYENRYFPIETGSNVYTLSIPQALYGEQIKPGNFVFEKSSSFYLVDDGNGNVYDVLPYFSLYVLNGYVLDGYVTGSGSDSKVGNIFYSHGIFVLTNQTYTVPSTIISSSLSFKSTNTIYETQVRCQVSENEFNLTQNPSAVSSSQGDYYPYITGSDFNPYTTTVGLYNSSDELLVVGKLAQPFRMPSNTDVTFIVKYDS
jgi:hypothetical protein